MREKKGTIKPPFQKAVINKDNEREKKDNQKKKKKLKRERGVVSNSIDPKI
jgi:hypothetical protein